jgi:Transposase DDE domain
VAAHPAAPAASPTASSRRRAPPRSRPQLCGGADLHGPHVSWAAARPPPAGGGRTSGPGWGVRPASAGAAGRARRNRSYRPGSGERGLLQPAGGQRGDLTGANPVDRGKVGSKLHLAGERGGLPVAVVLSAANANDSTMFEAVLEDIPPIVMPSGRRRWRPGAVHADKAYDHRHCRAYLRRRGIRPRIARRGIESSQRLGRYRWTIERTGACLSGWRRLRIRYEHGSERFYALVLLACAVICFQPCHRHGDHGQRSGRCLCLPAMAASAAPRRRSAGSGRGRGR